MSALLLLVAGVAVHVEGVSTCPTPEHVSERLATLELPRPERAEPDRARLSEREDHIEVELATGSGRVLGRRQFPRQASCDELASAIAVAIATWEAGTSSAPEVAIAMPAIASEPASSLTFAIGGGGLATYASAGWAIGGTAQLLVGSTASRWSARVTGFTTTAHRDMLAPGDVTWVRHGIGAGARYRIASWTPSPWTTALSFDATGDATFGVFRASGNGFSMDRSSASFDPGLRAGVSATLDRGRWAAVLELDELVWLVDRQLEVSGVSRLVDVPRHELQLNLGLVVRFAEI